MVYGWVRVRPPAILFFSDPFVLVLKTPCCPCESPLRRWLLVKVRPELLGLKLHRGFFSVSGTSAVRSSGKCKSLERSEQRCYRCYCQGSVVDDASVYFIDASKDGSAGEQSTPNATRENKHLKKTQQVTTSRRFPKKLSSRVSVGSSPV